MTEELFSLWLFFPDGSHHREAAYLGAEQAVDLAHDFTRRPAAQAGLIRRIIITDSGDQTCFEWCYGHGVTFPRRSIIDDRAGPR